MGDEKESQVKDMLNRQVNCANVIVLNKKDLVSTSHLNIIKAFVRVSNEDAVILESSFGKIPFASVTNTGLFSTPQAIMQ